MGRIQQAHALLTAGRIEEARAHATRARDAAPAAPGPHTLLARIEEAAGRTEAALACWLEAAARSGTDPSPWRELGRVALSLGRMPEAEMALQQAVQRGPRHAPSRRALAAALEAQGKAGAAVEQLLAAASLGAPAAVLVEAGDLIWRTGDRRKAVAIWTLATQRAPGEAAAWEKLARGQHALGHRAAAAHAAAQAALRGPDAVRHRLHGLLARLDGDIETARAALEASIALDPTDPGAAWALAACVPAVCPSEAEQAAVLARYDADLERVAALLARRPRDPRWPDAVQTAFPVHYLADDHTERQAVHGRLVAGAAAVVPTPAPAPRADPRVHVVAVSAYLRDHTVHKLFTGWLRDLDRTRFRVTALACPSREDPETAVAARAVDHFGRLPGDLPGALAAIAAQAPDVLLFPELGMDPQVLRIAAHRLAPVQAVAWGHPITTGLPTIDLFLSSAGMEPGGSWTHEQRVDLPGLGLHLTPCAPPDAPRDRAALGLPVDRPLLLSPQTLAKYRARADVLHARIARAAPEALLVFVEDPRQAVTAAFRDRMRRAFADAGLRLEEHVRVLPRQDAVGWRSLLLAGDLFLDSPDWSGGNTTLEALALGLPVLAFPGATMRGRHSLGIVREAGLPDVLAPDTADAWVGAAARIATDRALQASLRAAVQRRAPALFADRRGGPALEAALLEALSRRRG
jgi:predicted O-linked N-acetylglucosamine transferase (SPINDLY family)